VNPEVTARAADLRRTGVPFVHARVVRVERPTSAKPGDEAVVLPDGSLEGFVGGTCAEATVRAQSLSLLDSGESLLLRIAPDEDENEAPAPADGILTVVNPCLSGGALDIFLEPVVPAPALAVIGESPIAAALVALAEGVGFAIAEGAGASAAGEQLGAASAPDESARDTGTGADEGASEGTGGLPRGGVGLAAVVVASHGRDEDGALEAAVRAGVPYVGLVASRKRGEAVLAALDLDESQRAAIHTPAGLDIGARTPREVALSILAEIVSLRPRPSATPLVADLRMDGAPATSTDTADAGTGPGAGAGSGTPPGAAARPATAVDLVCGMTVVADDAALHLDHEGARFWFCGTGCLRAFAADPGAYLAPGADAGDRAGS
jgi:xanthine dehydrogenase accessory factor